MPEQLVNKQGLIMRGSLVHGEHRFEFPVLLTRDPDMKTVLLACVAPPLLCYTLNRFVVRPLWRRHRLQKVSFWACRPDHLLLSDWHCMAMQKESFYELETEHATRSTCHHADHLATQS